MSVFFCLNDDKLYFYQKKLFHEANYHVATTCVK